ncbi:Deoxynucleoside triphosphate triphosphohydrolase SAMHD1 [Aphelenchoides fujianensis]|nr:Deoxynucleoside triphosphate triphosphohydrolase SAMHD1 [Aphelenchoides fujianensis]
MKLALFFFVAIALLFVSIHQVEASGRNPFKRAPFLCTSYICKSDSECKEPNCRCDMSQGHYGNCAKVLEPATPFGSHTSTFSVLSHLTAALIHEIGHGPFSHTFDGPFMKRANRRPTGRFHEEGSIAMFEHFLEENPKVKEAFEELLSEEDFQFIAELINPPKPLVKDGEWQPKGRAKEKSFLFDIVSNPHSGLDVDKFDYFLRDSAMSEVGISFIPNSVQVLSRGIPVLPSERLGHQVIALQEKLIPELNKTHSCRSELHEMYKNKAVLGLESLLVDVLVAADPFLLFTSPSTGRRYRMSEAFEQMDVLEQLDDRVLKLIEYSTDPNLQKAKALYRRLKERRQPLLIGSWHLTIASLADEQEKKVVEALGALGVAADQLDIKRMVMDQGLGCDNHPLKHVLLYSPKKSPLKGRSFPKERIDRQSPGKTMVFVYLKAEEDFAPEWRAILSAKLHELVEEFVGEGDANWSTTSSSCELSPKRGATSVDAAATPKEKRRRSDEKTFLCATARFFGQEVLDCAFVHSDCLLVVTRKHVGRIALDPEVGRFRFDILPARLPANVPKGKRYRRLLTPTDDPDRFLLLMPGPSPRAHFFSLDLLTKSVKPAGSLEIPSGSIAAIHFHAGRLHAIVHNQWSIHSIHTLNLADGGVTGVKVEEKEEANVIRNDFSPSSIAFHDNFAFVLDQLGVLNADRSRSVQPRLRRLDLETGEWAAVACSGLADLPTSSTLIQWNRRDWQQTRTNSAALLHPQPWL